MTSLSNRVYGFHLEFGAYFGYASLLLKSPFLSFGLSYEALAWNHLLHPYSHTLRFRETSHETHETNDSHSMELDRHEDKEMLTIFVAHRIADASSMGRSRW